MTTTVLYDDGANDKDWGNGALFARAVVDDNNRLTFLISRVNYGNDTTVSFNIQNLEEVALIRGALDAIEAHLKKNT